MKQDDLSKAKEFALQMWEFEKSFIKFVPSAKERNLVGRLVVLEDKPLEHRSESEQWEIEAILEKLSEVPPYKKVAYPVGEFQPLRSPRSEVERAVQNEPHIKYGLASLEGFLAQTGLDRIPQPVTFPVVDGYGPMLQRAAERLAASQPKPTLWARIKGWFRRFGPKAVSPAPQLAPGTEQITVDALTAEYRALTTEELFAHLDAILAATTTRKRE